MIRFELTCDKEHAFEAWFRNGDDFAMQRERKLVACPHCGSQEVEKSLMAPAIAKSGEKTRMALGVSEEQKKALAQLKALSEKIRQNADYVGDRFAEEARKIHFGEVEPRGIYGEATPDEAKALAEEGVQFMPLPALPEDRN